MQCVSGGKNAWCFEHERDLKLESEMFLPDAVFHTGTLINLTHTRTRSYEPGSSCCFYRKELTIVSCQAYYFYVSFWLTKEVDIWLLIAGWLYGKRKSEVFGFQHLHLTIPHSAAAGTEGAGRKKCTHFTAEHKWKLGFFFSVFFLVISQWKGPNCSCEPFYVWENYKYQNMLRVAEIFVHNRCAETQAQMIQRLVKVHSNFGSLKLWRCENSNAKTC